MDFFIFAFIFRCPVPVIIIFIIMLIIIFISIYLLCQSSSRLESPGEQLLAPARPFLEEGEELRAEELKPKNPLLAFRVTKVPPQ